jgi:hypothetical protein
MATVKRVMLRDPKPVSAETMRENTAIAREHADSHKRIIALRGWVRSNLPAMISSPDGQQLIKLLGGTIQPSKVAFPGEK